jgi:hypothetical protein
MTKNFSWLVGQNIWGIPSAIFQTITGFDHQIWSLSIDKPRLPSGNLLHSYGKSPFLMGKSTISMVIFNSEPLNYQRVVKNTAKYEHEVVVGRSMTSTMQFQTTKGSYLKYVRLNLPFEGHFTSSTCGYNYQLNSNWGWFMAVGFLPHYPLALWSCDIAMEISIFE